MRRCCYFLERGEDKVRAESQVASSLLSVEVVNDRDQESFKDWYKPRQEKMSISMITCLLPHRSPPVEATMKRRRGSHETTYSVVFVDA